jgi:hypothetical protein
MDLLLRLICYINVVFCILYYFVYVIYIYDVSRFALIPPLGKQSSSRRSFLFQFYFNESVRVSIETDMLQTINCI